MGINMTGMPRSNLAGISDEEIWAIATSLKSFPLFWTPTTRDVPPAWPGDPANPPANSADRGYKIG
jgi:hypothetical protein